MFADETIISVTGGDGGDGCMAFYARRGKPCGGDGGNGGSIYARVNHSITSLSFYVRKKNFYAQRGKNGSKKDMEGRNGDDTWLDFPPSTEIKDLITGDVISLDTFVGGFLLASGGIGGRGNAFFNRRDNHVFQRVEKGTKGVNKRFFVTIKYIADFGLIGFPNAGKSSILNALTTANVKVAAYPFTTLVPNLGVLVGSERGVLSLQDKSSVSRNHFSTHKVIIADIPGIIEGAHTGKGLGDAFLKHIEKTKILLHCIPFDTVNIKDAYDAVRSELQRYGNMLTDKPEIVLLTKCDLAENTAAIEAKIQEVRETCLVTQGMFIKILPVSVLDTISISKLTEELSLHRSHSIINGDHVQ